MTYSVFAFGVVKGDFSDALPMVWIAIPILLVVWIAVYSIW
jgi:heme/copper-type cytochrome/quinol oxidase subunit 2